MSFLKGISPKTEYTSVAKHRYRVKVWADLARYVRPNTWAVIMPARGVEEIEVALSAGVPREQIFCFDASAAVIATSEWRRRFPDIKFAACKLCDLPKRLEKHGRYVSAINMDLCGNVAGESVDEIDAFLKSGILTERAAFSINLAKGREGRTLIKFIRRLGVCPWFDCERMAALFAISEFFNPDAAPCDHTMVGLNQGSYRENKTPMTWATFAKHKRHKPHHCDRHIALMKSLRDSGQEEQFSRIVTRLYERWGRIERASLNFDADRMSQSYAATMSRAVPVPRGFGQ